jgi:hypothetical protein
MLVKRTRLTRTLDVKGSKLSSVGIKNFCSTKDTIKNKKREAIK